MLRVCEKLERSGFDLGVNIKTQIATDQRNSIELYDNPVMHLETI